MALDSNVSPSRAANVVDDHDDEMSNMSDMLAGNPADVRDTPDRTGNLLRRILHIYCARKAQSPAALQYNKFLFTQWNR
jgi:hypothetical protein